MCIYALDLCIDSSFEYASMCASVRHAHRHRHVETQTHTRFLSLSVSHSCVLGVCRTHFAVAVLVRAREGRLAFAGVASAARTMSSWPLSLNCTQRKASEGSVFFFFEGGRGEGGGERPRQCEV